MKNQANTIKDILQLKRSIKFGTIKYSVDAVTADRTQDMRQNIEYNISISGR
jgi:hypothetical protein